MRAVADASRDRSPATSGGRRALVAADGLTPGALARMDAQLRATAQEWEELPTGASLARSWTAPG